jgi:hypothetical protein
LVIRPHAAEARVERDRPGRVEKRGEGHGKRLRTLERQDLESGGCCR